MLELPYQDPSKALLIILPQRENDTVMDLISSTDFASIRGFRVEPRSVDVMLPKFKVKAKTKLKQLMMQQGVRNLFTDQANLTGISDQPIKVTDAVQEAFIEVNEEGTEAAAATAVILGLRIASPRREAFIMNRPFGFVVYDFEQNIPLFMGKINKPDCECELVTRSTTPRPTSKPKDPCLLLIEQFSNALNNVELCKQAKDEKLFDWLRRYRATCDESDRVNTSFKKNKCESRWCEYAFQNLQRWASTQRTCESNSGTRRQSRELNDCRTIDNRLKAFESLKCEAIPSPDSDGDARG